jgi:hypothetical protein
MPEEGEMVYTRIRAKWGLAPGASPPVSPESLANMAQQIASQPVPDLMARNVQQQQQSQVLRHGSIPQFQTGLTAMMAPSPAETVDSRRTSSGMSLPPVSAAELSRDAQRIRASTYLTKAQQDAWNAHQARLATAAAATSSNRAGDGGEQNAARMFGGVDSLIEETQDWIFKDQNQFAMGFENWNSDPPDWGTLDLSFFDTQDGTGSSTNDNTNGNSPAYTSGMQYSYDPTTAPNSGVVGANGGGGGYAGGFPSTSYPSTATGKIANNTMNSNGINSLMNPSMGSGLGMGGGSFGGNGSMAATMGGNMNVGREGSGVKRRSQIMGFDDDVYY